MAQHNASVEIEEGSTAVLMETDSQTCSDFKIKTTTEQYEPIKRMLDIILSAGALLVLCPIMLVVAVVIMLDSKGGVFFAQERVGKSGKLFKMYKFRSMQPDAEDKLEELVALNERSGPAFKMHSDPRVTRVGKWLRKSSLDELPQLWNILCGDMSIVGPRPALPREVAQYTEYQMQRIYCTPGLTCYWQISNRKMEFDDWVALDLQYIYNHNLKTDVTLIWKTLLHVLHLKGC